MDPTDFATTYVNARQAFRETASKAGARLDEYPVEAQGREGEPLAVDVARVGDAEPRWAVVVSSGLHGVEGFFGSAVQVAWLQALAAGATVPGRGSVALVHAINPFGLSWRRRVNEGNVDLNRNFLLSHERYEGTPPGYAALDPLLNPATPPYGDLFLPRMLWSVLRHGVPALKNVIAVGQYDYPDGLFFGGKAPTTSTRIVQGNFQNWLGAVNSVVHVDLHTGLGKWGQYRLLVEEPEDSARLPWYRDRFGVQFVQSLSPAGGIAFQARGAMGAWLAYQLRERDYRFLAAEFGTYNILRVLATLRAENRAHLHDAPDHPAYERAKRRLLERFCPESPNWRRSALNQGLKIIDQAVRAAHGLAGVRRP